MKTFFLVLSFMVIVFACKKDKNSNNKQLYLSKVFKDGLLETEYFYDGNKRPYRRNEYSTNGVSNYTGFRLYEYNSNNLLETTTFFSKDNNFIQKYRIQYNANKQPSRMDDLANDNTVQFYHIYDYNIQGDLSTYSIFNANTNKKNAEATLSYNADRKLTKMIRKVYVSNPPYLLDSSTYSFNKLLPSHWTNFETLVFASLPNADRTFMDMICDSSFFYYPDTPPITNKATFSGKQYNSEGYLIKQHFNYKYTNSLGSSTSDIDRTYEYIE